MKIICSQRNSYKYYLLLTQETIFYFTHSAFLTIKSIISSLPFVFFSLLTPSLSPPMASSLPTDFSLYLPLFSFFSLFVLPSITLFLNKFFFFSSHRSVNSSITIFGIYQIIWSMWHFELFKMELMGIMVILNYEKYV